MSSADPCVTVRYWAGAKAAAGVAEESLPLATFRGTTLADLLVHLQDRHGVAFSTVLSACSFLVSEHPVAKRASHELRLVGGEVVDVLPPFAGGAEAA